MTWDCCNPAGQCQQGHGCPVGASCHRQAACKDTACPGHPGRTSGLARVGKQHALRNVMLDASQHQLTAPKPRTARRVLQLVGAAAVVGIWMLATATADNGGPCTHGHAPCNTSWESEA